MIQEKNKSIINYDFGNIFIYTEDVAHVHVKADYWFRVYIHIERYILY